MKILAISAVVLTALLTLGCGGQVKENAKYNYITADETAKLMREDASKLVLVDIQEKPDFEEEHLKGAISTYAYPVKTDAEKARLAELLPNIKPDQKVVIVCPRGGGGADRAYDFYLEKGLKKEQLFTLKGGQYEWPRDKIKDVLDK
ncbi:MAG: rhodanese-like domain-containing protein [Epsilonproteobacteria bacterium]|jgi:rhodanese-related sulfurtransferase|uniref:rhodanese-like domain-containing protein n=1 Tax=Sulfurospirillum cavolei TaxID=366522 RepID=UPI003FA1F385|nr:rhodanese-like domain-containing protein [Campylobacterota bacterium]